ncbi:aldehyde dehydrogenase family protein [Jiangella asiatica]|uniref:Aldehyde dehydrogenase family protein n=1 Tax=Jiangella asiatica TaxID=2530372 RepID=A0A4R5D4W6_9ACTN|nr:aldehyde dehydrogenase family protein [Jiangella asiatica]TDE08452.1 aldehyde dehydrogenase family protein [Jiangella asiatica]
MSLLEPRTWSGQIFDGTWTPGGGGSYDTVEPATGLALARVGAGSAPDVRTAARVAAEAQRSWAGLTYDRRAAVLRRAGELFAEHHEEIARWIVREAGASSAFASHQTLAGAAEECWQAAALAALPYGELIRSSQPRLSLTRRLPVGVVGVIAPFNAPMVLAIRAVAPALAVGNAVVLKPDPRTAVCGGVAIARVFEEAGLPEGLLHLIPGGADVGAAVVDDPAIPVIAFTGSTAAGRAIARAAADRLKRVHLELGGNSALVVFDDVDLEHAASCGAFGSFNHAGQICMASSRHLVEASIADDYAAVLAEHARKLPVGNPMDDGVTVGPLIDAGQRDLVHSMVTSSVAAGAALLTGGEYDGLFYRPTVLAGVPSTAPAYAREIFGPVAPVVPFRDLDDAARLAAGTEYGLSLGILTQDLMRAMELAERIPSGLVHINDQTINDEATAPFGGVADSGNGSRHGSLQANLEAFTEQQWVTIRGAAPRYPF